MYMEKITILKVLLIYVVFQNISAMLLSAHGVFYGKLAILLKDFLLYFIVLLYLLSASIRRTRDTGGILFDRRNIFDILIYAYLFILTIYFLLPYGNSNFFIRGVSFRQLLIMPMLYIVGRLLSGIDLGDINKFIIGLGFFICVFSVIELLVLGDNFWKTIGMYDYMNAKGFAPWTTPDGVSGSFYTWDYMHFIKTGYGTVRRMVGVHGDAMLTAQFLVYPSIVLYSRLNFLSRPIGTIMFFVFAIIIMLTFSKGGVLMLFISIVTVLIFNNAILRKFRMLWLIAAVVGPIVIAAFLSKYSASSIPAHFTGLASNLGNLIYKPFGYGIGALGNYAVLLADKSLESSVGAGESYLGTMIGQIGLFAALFFLMFTYLIYKKIGQEYNENRRILLSVLFALLCTTTLSESAITYTGSGYILLLFGIISDDICGLAKTKVAV